MRIALFALGGIGLAYLALVAVLFLAQRALIYPAPREAQPCPQGYRIVTLHTRDGLDLRGAWHAPHDAKPTVLFFHGNGDSLTGAALATAHLARAGFGVLLADYRGYAGNPGSPSETGLRLDAEAALRFLDDKNIPANRRVLMGASLGGGVAIQAAARHDVAALVLVSTFTSLPDVAAAKLPGLPVRLLIKDRFDSLGTLRDIDVPTLVLHASDDQVIPIAHGRKLAEAARKGRFHDFASAGHALQFTGPPQDTIVAWLTDTVPST